jgi:carboxylesterase
MAGHGQTAVELATTTYLDWIELARGSLAKLRAESEQVFVVGLSMGGLVTLALSAENLADAVAVMGTPLHLDYKLRFFIPLLKHLTPYRKNTGPKDIQNEAAAARHPSLGTIPLASIHEIAKIQKIVRRGLPKITAPIFVGHGALDRTAKPKDAREIFGEVNASERALHICARSGHVVSVDHDGPAVSQAIAEFLERQVR